MFNQAIDTANVRRETLDGTDYVVAPINLLQPMYLNVPSNWDATEAYLPAQQAKESLPSWNGTPLTLNHPTSNGVATTANQPEMVAKTVLGRVYNADWDNDKATAEAWFDEQKIRDMGGVAENALEEVLEGNTVEVSTGYRASKLPSGEYDGETHNAVQGNLKPDHVAVLPNNKGKCSVEAGCGVGAVAANMIVTNAEHGGMSNGDIVEWDSSGGMAMGVIRDTISEGEYDEEIDGDVTVSAPAALLEVVEEADGELRPTGTMVAHKTDTDTLSMVDDPPELAENALSEARTPTYDGTETQSWADVSKDLEAWADALDIDADTVADMSESERETVAAHTLLGDPGAETWQELSFFPVVNPNTGDLNQGALMAVLSGRGAQADIPNDTLESARDVAGELLESEFDEDDMSENGAFGRLYNALAGIFENSGETAGAESLVDTDDTTTNTMPDKTAELVDNHGFEAQNLPDEETDCFDAIYNRFVGEESEEGEDSDVTNTEKVVFDSQEEFEAAVNDIVEDREAQSEKQQLASEIASNSTEYEDTEAVLEDYPTEAALNTKHKDLTGGANFGATRGASASPATNEENAEDLTMFGGDA